MEDIMWYDFFLKRNLLPEFFVRSILKIHLKLRFRKEPKKDEVLEKHIISIVDEMKNSPISIHTDVTNEQHYELPPKFFQLVLGKNLKYSCGLWEDFNRKFGNLKELDRSEDDMLNLTIERADIKDGQAVLDLGCGWGSISILLAKKFPRCQILAISNSHVQKNYIDSIAELNDINNLEVITNDINNFQTSKKFDRIVSIEMFEHMRNYQSLLHKLSNFLKSEGKLFIHIFTDKRYPYFFELTGRSNWMANYFFRGGLMPSVNLLCFFLDDFSLQKFWKVNGLHYKKTLRAWLFKMKTNKKKIKEILANHYGKKKAKKWWNLWKVFFIVLSEVFGYDAGNKRFVSHYLLKKK